MAKASKAVKDFSYQQRILTVTYDDESTEDFIVESDQFGEFVCSDDKSAFLEANIRK